MNGRNGTPRRADQASSNGARRSSDLRQSAPRAGAATRLELWGGIECTVHRLGDRWFDQVVRTGHDRRLDDLDRFAELGIAALRYPALWERAVARVGDDPDFHWTDERLTRLRALGIRPILGLVHHGSGPRGTSLLDPEFPTKLAAYAAQVARRYPWVRDWTPVNEPLTTARFSALYGHWYPHARDGLAWARALLHQCRAVALAMRAIREVRPDARLVQTEDLGHVHATPRLARQAWFENERRWITWDLLGGRVTRDHPIGQFLLWLGVPWPELAWFLDSPCPSDVIGINHYVTSERFLDHRVERHPGVSPGGNGIDRYVDVEAVREPEVSPLGLEPLLEAAWARYGLPVAVTECQLGCTREEQVRWLREFWDAAGIARARGVPVEAVTLWALLGACDWSSLLTRMEGRYECGAFDVRSGKPRPTALARAARRLVSGDAGESWLEGPGWWRRPIRCGTKAGTSGRLPRGAPLVVTGAGGTLGRAFVAACRTRGLAVVGLRRADLDVTDVEAVSRALESLRPWAVVNASGWVHVDGAEADEPGCRLVNVTGAGNLARACAARDARLVTFSSDLVFGGARNSPWLESDRTAPLNAYGRSKRDTERVALAGHPDSLVVRTSAFFGPDDGANFVTKALASLDAGDTVLAPDDECVSPTYVPDLVDATLDLVLDGERGLWHLANAGAVTWHELARMAAARAGVSPRRLRPCAGATLVRPAARPPYSVLGTERGSVMAPLDDALARYVAAVAAARAPVVPGEVG